MDKSGLANHKLTVGKGINVYPLYQQNYFALFHPVTVAVNDLCPEGRSLFPPVILMMQKKKKKKTKLKTSIFI